MLWDTGSVKFVGEQRHNRSRFSCVTSKYVALLVIITSVLFLIGGCGNNETRIQSRDTVLAGDSASQGALSSQSIKPPLRIAVAAMISPETTREFYDDLLALIASKADRTAVFSQRRTYAEVNELLESREVDLAFVCAGPSVTGHDEFGMELLAVPVVHRQKVYHSYIIVPAESSSYRFADLRGQRFAFTDPNSNTGCLVPTFMLAGKGETPDSFFSDSFFTHSHDNSITAVAEGKVDGGAVDSLIWEFMSVVEPELVSRTRVVEKSPPYGIPPVVVHPDLDPVLKDRLRGIFFSLHRDPEAFEILNKLQIDRFGKGEDSMYDSVREMKRWVGNKEQCTT